MPPLKTHLSPNKLLSGEKWGAGPTAVALKQDGPWTYGGLENHIWSFAGDDSRVDISTTYLQPFVTYITKTHASFILNTESSYDWKNEQWAIPINGIVSQMLKIGGAPLSVLIGVRYCLLLWVNLQVALDTINFKYMVL